MNERQPHTAISESSRPIRVCYAVPIDSETTSILTAIFKDAYNHWGGRHSIVVPISDGRIDSAYYPWLHWLDPDILYTYSDISNETLEAIDRICMPVMVERHRDNSHPAPGLMHIPRIPALSVLPMLPLTRPFFVRGRFSLLGAYPQWHDAGFWADSFGLSPASPGYAQQTLVDDMVEHITLTPEDAPENRWHTRRANREETSQSGLLRMMARDLSITSMAQLSAIHCHLAPYRSLGQWGRSFSIVVGDSAIDRLCFWNGRLSCPRWQDGEITALRVPQDRITDSDFTDALIEFIALRDRFESQNGPRWATIRTASVDHQLLQPIIQGLGRRNVIATIDPITSVSDCVPTSEDLASATDIPQSGATRYISDLGHFLSDTIPSHLRVSSLPLTLRRGYWAVDIAIEQPENKANGLFGSSTWRFPRKWQVVRYIAGSLNSKISLFNDTRIFQCSDQPSKLKTPGSGAEVVQVLFTPRRYLTTTDLRAHLSDSHYDGLSISDKGRYFAAAVRMFGGLHSCYEYLANKYWQDVFLAMAAPARNLTDEERGRRANRLKSRLGIEVVSGNDDWLRLADVVSEVAAEFRAPRPVKSFRWLLSRYKSIVGEDADSALLQSAIERLTINGVFAQGWRWRCERCGYRNWTSLQEIKPLVECQVCGNATNVPPAFDWDFRLNDLLAEGLREHGLLGLVWALGHLAERSRYSFFFSPPIELFDRTQRRSLGDVDIACCSDGSSVIGEAKESARRFNNEGVAKLATWASSVRADRVILACLDTTSLGTLEGYAAGIRSNLERIDCQVEAIVPDPRFGSFETMAF